MEAARRTRDGEMLPTLAVGWQTSALRGKEAGQFREVADVSIIGFCVCSRQFNSRQQSGLNNLVIELSGSVNAGFVLALPFHHGDLEPDCVGVSTSGEGAYAGDKNASARLCAKNAGGAYA